VFGGILGFESFVEGAQGWVAVASNVIPGPLAKLFTLVADDKRIAGAHALYLRMLPLIEFVGGQSYVAGTQALLTCMGFPAGRPHPPRLPLSPGREAAAARLVADFHLSFPGGLMC
jgi:4-hydroxy-tetrahydrodipicolinate synthase